MSGRQADLFDTTVSIARDGTGAHALNGSTLVATPDATTSVYVGAALVRPEGSTEVDAGEQREHLARFLIKVPVDTDLQIGDVVTITASNHDADLVGAVIRIDNVVQDEWQISRRATGEQQRGA